MKLRHPLLIKAVGFGLAGIISIWLRTLRYRSFEPVSGVSPWSPGQTETFIYAFWHETLLIPSLAYRHHKRPQNGYMLISQHADGELIAQVCRHLGIRVTRGSTKRGGAAALMQLQKLLENSHVVLTPDGPRGPRRVCQVGAVKLASETGCAIVPLGFAIHRCWRAPSWDRFAVPFPFTRCVGVNASPIRVPPGISRAELEEYRLKFEASMLDVTKLAEDYAGKGW